jgi:hypothetical protein
MNREKMLLRFEELEAGRVLGELDARESAEWADLAGKLGCEGDRAMELLAAEMEFEMSRSLPPASWLERFRPRGSRRKAHLAWLGWAAAAGLLGLLCLERGGSNQREARSALALRDALMREERANLSNLRFSGTGGTFANTTGEVVWSDDRQEGYLTLEGIPANDPARHHYQLWIVDPERDEIPVDGGVFSIPEGVDRIVVPVDAKLEVNRPTAFVITLEKPGGVVRSDQKVVVAVAQR